MAEASDEAPRRTDVVLALCLAVFAQFDLRFNLDNSTRYGSGFATASVVALATVALVWCRRRPLATLCVVVAVIAGPELFSRLTVTLWGHFVPLLIIVYAVARWCDGRRAAVGLLLAFAAIAVLMLRVPSVSTADNVPFAVVPISAAFLAGRVLQHRQRRHHDLAVRASWLEADRDAQISAAVADERARIARELHDIVAHCVSVMVVQAGASEDLLDREPERAREPLRAVQETGQQAVAELGRMLGLLRGTGAGTDPPGLAPQPGTAQLPELAERMSTLGLPVQLTASGRRRPRADRHDRARHDLRRDHRGRRAAGRRLPRVHHAATGPGVIRVLIADDQALVRGGFRSILDGQPDIEVVGEAQDGIEAIEMARRHAPDVVLMDIRMPRMDGLAATRTLFETVGDRPRVLVLTTFDHDDYVYDALRAGASGFLLKSAPPRELAGAIRTVAAGDALLAPEITRRLIQNYLARPRPSAAPPPGFDTLTPRETEVLMLIARGRSNGEIAADLYLSEPTVKTHVTRVFAKLGVRDRVQAVVFAYEAGLVQPGVVRRSPDN